MPWYPPGAAGRLLGLRCRRLHLRKGRRRCRGGGGVYGQRRRQLHGRWVGKGLMVTLITSGRQNRRWVGWSASGWRAGSDASSVTTCPNRRLRTNASTAHPTGESTGVGGLSGANGPKPANPSTPRHHPAHNAGGVIGVGGCRRQGLASNHDRFAAPRRRSP